MSQEDAVGSFISRASAIKLNAGTLLHAPAFFWSYSNADKGTLNMLFCTTDATDRLRPFEWCKQKVISV